MMRNPFIFLFAPLLLLISGTPAVAVETADLPSLGDSTSGIISAETERRLGSAWLRELRSRTVLFYDPLVDDYVEHLAYRVASHADIAEPRLSLAILNNSEINAFAVPGGVLGVNAGVILNAASEDEFAAVLAHELAHLSQRHYARGLDQQRRTQPLALTALLASILVAATVGGDAGAAALMSTQAGMMQSQLSFSRDNEREADRIGMQSLARAGYSPAAMPSFFERLLHSQPADTDQYPEFLMTHPITESRISDARNRAQQLPVSNQPRDALEYTLTRARVQVAFVRDPAQAVREFEGAMTNASVNSQAPLRYGFALALLRAHRDDDALAALAPLLKAEPERIAYRVAEGEILLDDNRSADAAARLTDALALSPDNFPLAMVATHAWLLAGNPAKARALIERQAVLRPDDPNVWQAVAKARADTGDDVGVHAARAEYLFLRAQWAPAREQLQLGIRKAGEDFARAAPLRNRLQEIDAMKDDFQP